MQDIKQSERGSEHFFVDKEVKVPKLDRDRLFG